FGAFTDNLDELESLARCRIPVYFARPLERAGSPRIDRLADFLLPYADQTITLHNHFCVDLTDSIPAHHVIYTGLARKPERYLTMGNYVASLFEYPSFLGTFQPRSSTSIQKASLPIALGAPIRQASSATHWAPAPCKLFMYYVPNCDSQTP
ncbi:hypothetical protein L218DRAFT_1035812, partial [Marasmius fiardii PR-910]